MLTSGGKGKHAHSHRNRGGHGTGEHDLNLSHQSREGSSYLTRYEQQPGRGAWAGPCALQDRKLYISAQRLDA